MEDYMEFAIELTELIATARKATPTEYQSITASMRALAARGDKFASVCVAYLDGKTGLHDDYVPSDDVSAPLRDC